MAGYSRRSSVENSKNVRRAIILGILTVVLIILFVFFGLPFFARFAGIITDIRQGNTSIDPEDTTPPAPPKIVDLPEYTNEFTVKVEGNTEAGATVVITENGDEVEILADNSGKFNHIFELNDGTNTLKAKSVDLAKNESQETETYTIIYDNEEPVLSIASPETGSEFFGSSQRQITIQGETEAGSSVAVNDRIVVVNDTGSFSYTVTLAEGNNEFKVVASDKAGNEAEITVNYSFTP